MSEENRASEDFPHFRVSPRALGPLGAEQLQDPALAVLELVKNSWDADATRVTVTIRAAGSARTVSVDDDGLGMSRQDFLAHWLVIGASHKRDAVTTERHRPFIGEKGLGRLATFALGSCVTVTSKRSGEPAFAASVNWPELLRAQSLEQHPIAIASAERVKGTLVEITDIASPWTEDQTTLLVTHAEFLTAIPGQRFKVRIMVDGRRHTLDDPFKTIARLAEARMEVAVADDGTPSVTSCAVGGTPLQLVHRKMKSAQHDPSLAGVRISLLFLRRDVAARNLGKALDRNTAAGLLERYEGIRVFRDGINVPPFGLQGNDWAALEKQRTRTGGPTMVPGNSQLVGEVHVTKRGQPHLVVTAGRSGFADQAAVGRLANYVRWAVKELGTIRRAEHLGISSGHVPGRVDPAKAIVHDSNATALRRSLTDALTRSEKSREPQVRQLADLSQKLLVVFDVAEDSLRMYAQLASTGIAATSFAHELRTEFDVITEGLEQLSTTVPRVDQRLVQMLGGAWSRIASFAALFQILPVKLRRKPSVLSPSDLRTAVTAILRLAPPERFATNIVGAPASVRLVPAEFDAIVLNLVSNAVKAVNASATRESGQIRVTLGTVGRDLLVAVADNGCGVTPEVATIMFEPHEGEFSEGTGMGLPIVRFIAERYSGLAYLAERAPTDFVTEFRVLLRNVVREQE